MKVFSTLLLAAGFTFAANAATTNLITNGSFESGTNGWILFVASTNVTFQTNATAYAGARSLRVANRQNFAEAPQQDVTAQLALATNGATWVTRLAVQVAQPAQVRAWLEVAADVSGSPVTNHLILAEAVVRATNQWVRLDGVKTISWNGALSHALFYLECGNKVEAPPASLAYPNTLFDAIEILPDDDGDFLANAEEVSPPNGYGTLANNRDSDGDGLPDGWEVFNGTSATTNDAAADPDRVLASNWQDNWAATSPTNAASYPGRPRTNILSQSAQAVLAYLAKLPAAGTSLNTASNRVIVGQHVTDIEHDWSNNVATLPGLTGKWPGIVSFSAEGGSTAVPQMSKVIPRALEVWTNGGIPLIKFQFANPWTMTNTALTGLERITDMLRVAPTNSANAAARSNYLALRDNIGTNLAVLRDAGVVVLFRPCSEMNGGWFWHGSKPRAEYIALWRDLHDEFTFARGLTNLLWVYESDAAFAHIIGGATNSSGSMVDYYFPGDDLVDIAGHNLYDDDWMLPFDSDAIWRRYGKVFAVPQAGKGSGQAANTNWSNLTYLNGISNTVPRSSFICVWNSFVNGTPVLHAISDNAQPSELMNAAWTVTRDEVNWRYELPFSLSMELATPNQLHIHWQGGALQRSDDLQNWSEIPNAPSPFVESTANGQGFFRLHRSY